MIDAADGADVLVGVAGAARAATTALRAGAAGVKVHALTDPYVTSDGIARSVETVAAAADGIIVPYLRGRRPVPAALDQVSALEQTVAAKWAIPDVPAFVLFVHRRGRAALQLCGLAAWWAPFLALAGSRGLTSGLVNVDAALPLALQKALAAGDYATATALWRRIMPFEAFRARHDAGHDVPGVKEAMAVAGIIPCAAVRPPLAALSPGDRAELERIVRELDPRR